MIETGTGKIQIMSILLLEILLDLLLWVNKIWNNYYKYLYFILGIYACDALAMSLHILYNTNNFNEAILKAVNIGGDADSVGNLLLNLNYWFTIPF